jgi:hypothetical protein
VHKIVVFQERPAALAARVADYLGKVLRELSPPRGR